MSYDNISCGKMAVVEYCHLLKRRIEEKAPNLEVSIVEGTFETASGFPVGCVLDFRDEEIKRFMDAGLEVWGRKSAWSVRGSIALFEPKETAGGYVGTQRIEADLPLLLSSKPQVPIGTNLMTKHGSCSMDQIHVYMGGEPLPAVHLHYKCYGLEELDWLADQVAAVNKINLNSIKRLGRLSGD